MALAGKCKEDFLNWYKNRLSVMTYAELLNINDLTVFNALIIEFFDSRGINILISNLDYQNWWWYDIKHFPNTTEGKNMFNSRQEALKEGIKKAVEIYNK